MQTVGIKTAQNIDIDYNVAGLGERIIARIIDYALYLAVFLLYSWLFKAIHSSSILWDYTFPEILFFVFYAFYDIVCETFFNGQSLGKYIMKIKVVSLDGARPRFGQYLMRYIFRAVDFLLTLGVGAIVSVSLTDNKQRIGDIVAGTTLVKTKRRTVVEDLSFTQTEIGYEPVFRGVLLLKDADIALINEVINKYHKNGNFLLIENTGKRIKEYLDIDVPKNMEMYKFLDTVVKDYNHLSAHMDTL
ncbi:MAG TPA: RDD family protein [Mucilaginibacter sp.]|nr:RDD family protein [Mucilaginibacter sp.]